MEEHIKKALTYRAEEPDSISSMLDLHFIECDAERGEVTLSHLIHEREINIFGTLHGGIITWLMDSCMGIISRAYTNYDTLVTMDIHVNFLKAVYAGENAVIKAKVTHAGKRIINTISELYVEDKLCATADAIFYNLNYMTVPYLVK